VWELRQKTVGNFGLEQVIGSFQDEPAFEEVLAYGRAIRKGELSIWDVDP
jgi:hypothetical protein